MLKLLILWKDEKKLLILYFKLLNQTFCLYLAQIETASFKKNLCISLLCISFQYKTFPQYY